MISMKLPGAAIILFIAMLVIVTSIPPQQSSGFKSLANEDDRSCIEADVCHDISDYRRTTQGAAYPYEHCICHSEIPDSGTLIEVKGPRTVQPGEKVKYTIVIYGGMGVSYGFGINATNGTLNKNYQFSPLETNEIEIEYMAPDIEQTVYITFVGLSSDGDLEVKPVSNETAGDTWNLNKITVEIKKGTNTDEESSMSSFIIILMLVMIIIIILVLIRIRKGKLKRK